jgi:hypothetical protein
MIRLGLSPSEVKVITTYSKNVAISFTFCYIVCMSLQEAIQMRYTIDEQGTMNNYAAEPKMYFAEYPSQEQQRSYLFQGAIATLLVFSTLLIALAVS